MGLPGFVLYAAPSGSSFTFRFLLRQFDSSTVHETVCYCPDWGGRWIMAPAYTQRVQENHVYASTVLKTSVVAAAAARWLLLLL